jgi:sortase (surface protein transpeptidase)
MRRALLTAATCAMIATTACSTNTTTRADNDQTRTAENLTGNTQTRPTGDSPSQTTKHITQEHQSQAASGDRIRTAGDGSARAAQDVAEPVRLRVPAIGLSTRVIPLRLDANGRLIAPTAFDRVGWNKAGPEPGEKGAAVIAGHVDSKTGPAVFYRLPQLRKGDRVHVDRADGSTVTFTVDRLARYPKSRIPNKEVYGPGRGGGAQLRLITCGGTFDRTRGSYRDNVIVFAH